MRSAEAGRPLRVLGPVFGVAVTVGSTIGVGILRTPGHVAELLPNAWLFLAVWVAGSLYALLGVISLAELGAMLPRSGGQYVFARRALGPYAGFVVGWNDWVSTCGSVAAVAIVVGEYSAAGIPALASQARTLAIATVFILAVLQWRGTRAGGRIQEWTSLVKACTLLTLVVACFVLSSGDRAGSPAAVALPRGMSLLGAIVLALQAAIFTYDGWTGVLYFSGEVERPGKAVPRAMFGGLAAVTIIYLAVNVGFLRALSLPRMAGDDFVAATVAHVLAGDQGDRAARWLLVAGLVSSVSANLLMAPRVLFAMSGDGLAPGAATRTNTGGTPTMALLASATVAVLFIATGTFEEVLAVMAFFFVASYVVSFTVVFRLRAREPLAQRPYRAWGYPWTTGLALLGSLAFLVGAAITDARNSLVAMALLVASYPAYLAARTFARRR